MQTTLTLILNELKSMNGRLDNIETDVKRIDSRMDRLEQNMATLINANTTLSQEFRATNENLQK